MAATYFYTYVNVQIAIVEPLLLQAVRSNLYHLGCREIGYTDTLSVLRERLKSGPCDLLLIQADLGHGKMVPALINAVRHGEVSSNPFMPIVAVTHAPTPEQVKALVDVGVDDILPYPWSQNYVDTRLENLIHNRKPFVVTSDYIGPDRRQKTREDGRSAPVKPLIVPNPLRAKALDRTPSDAIEEQIRTMAERVNIDKILRLAELIVRLSGELTSLGKAGQQTSSVVKNGLQRLADASKALIRRAGETDFASRCTHVNTLHRTSMVMIQAMEASMEPELHLLENLAMRVSHEFGIHPSVFHAPVTQGVIDKRVASAKAGPS